MKYLMYFFFMLMIVVSLSASKEDETEIQCSISRHKIYIGDTAILLIKVIRPVESSLKPPDMESLRRVFEISDPMITEKEMDHSIQTQFQYNMTSFEPGEYSVEPVGITISLKDGKKLELKTSPLKIVVESLVSDDPKNSDIKGPKPVLSIKRSLWPMIIVLSILTLVTMSTIIMVKRLRPGISNAAKSDEIILSPEDEAMDALEHLRKSDELMHKKMKYVYSELSFILRRFLMRKYAFNAIEMTTQECLEMICEVVKQGSQYASIKKILNMSDLVKFAKYIPDVSDVESCIHLMKEIVQFSKGIT